MDSFVCYDKCTYWENGDITPRGKNKAAMIEGQMIEKMALNSYHLTRNRRNAIEASEVFEDIDYSDDDLRDFIGYYDNKQDGKYIPFCQSIIDCLARMSS